MIKIINKQHHVFNVFVQFKQFEKAQKGLFEYDKIMGLKLKLWETVPVDEWSFLPGSLSKRMFFNVYLKIGQFGLRNT